MEKSLHDSTIKKIFREHFQGEMPITKYGSEEQKRLISDIKQKLETIDGIKLLKLSDYRRYHQEIEPEEHCDFKIISSSKYYRDQEFCLEFNEQSELSIREHYFLNTPVYHLEQIYTLVDKMIQEYKRIEINYLKREGKKLKQQKIKDIKYKAIFAKIHEIAKEDKFKFCVTKYFKYVKLTIYLAQAEEMQIEIPYDKFHETLKSLRVTIQTIRDLRHSGLKFQIQSYPMRYYNEPSWITYDWQLLWL